jgi:uncharacterized protein (DUF58 family)
MFARAPGRSVRGALARRSASGPAGPRWRWTTWPRRTLWPTRDGWWCLAATVGLGFAAMNTGNNLLYLLVSMLFGLIIVSGVLSEQSIRGLGFVPVLPEEVQAHRPALLGVRVVNRKRWRTSYSIGLEVLDETGARRSAHLARLDPGAEQLVTWEVTYRGRGRRGFPPLRVSTRFPFGLFVKAGQLRIDAAVVVFPAVRPVARSVLRELALRGAPSRRRGHGSDLYNLREYRAGDDRRLIHWRSSAKIAGLMVREPEADTAREARILLVGDGSDGERLEAGLSEAASLASHLLRAGGAVELAGPASWVPLAHGREHRRRVLTALALYDPGSPAPAAARGRTAVTEIRVAIG